MTEIETQPTGETVEQTLAVVSHVLSDPSYAAKVREDNDLASRYQWSVGLLSMQTTTLANEIQGLARRIVDLEDRAAAGS